jgi:nitrile hydratase beta subunit
MNGIHDMGGMHGMGSIERQTSEPVFHAPWEGRVLAMMFATVFTGKLPGDSFRHQIEIIPPSDYLRMSYYEKWLTALVERLVSTGLATRDEIKRGKRARGSARTIPSSTAQVLEMISKGAPVPAEGAMPRFQVGQRVRARDLNPVGHTRLPRYARGKLGTIDSDLGLTVLQDSEALSHGRTPQHVYSVRFMARELWGDRASPRDSVYIDLWEDYLERA